MSGSMSFVSWNLAMLGRSAQAPPDWGMEHTEAEVRARLLQASPDMVLFQELPRMVPYLETHDMLRSNPETHSGNLAFLLSHELMAAEASSGGPRLTTVAGCAVMATFASGLTVANVHLAPGAASVGVRLEQLAEVVENSPTPDLLIVGDTNTRIDEEEPLAAAGLTGVRPRPATWNSKTNRFHSDTPRFTAYFTRWFATQEVKVSGVEVWREPVSHDGVRFHLSDHFALAGTVELAD